jgi:hypothetical protein
VKKLIVVQTEEMSFILPFPVTLAGLLPSQATFHSTLFAVYYIQGTYMNHPVTEDRCFNIFLEIT